MHDADCPLAKLDPQTSGPNGARALEDVLDGMDFTDGVKPGTVEHLIGELLAKGFRITSGSRGEPQSHHHYVAPILEPRCTCDIARKLLIEHGAIPHSPSCPVAQEDARSSVGGAIPDAPHRADAGTGTSTRVVETPDDLCVVSIFGRVNEIAPGHGVGTTSASFAAEGARELRDRLDVYLARVEHRASEPPAPRIADEEVFSGVGRALEILRNPEIHGRIGETLATRELSESNLRARRFRIALEEAIRVLERLDAEITISAGTPQLRDGPRAAASRGPGDRKLGSNPEKSTPWLVAAMIPARNPGPRLRTAQDLVDHLSTLASYTGHQSPFDLVVSLVEAGRGTEVRNQIEAWRDAESEQLCHSGKALDVENLVTVAERYVATSDPLPPDGVDVGLELTKAIDRVKAATAMPAPEKREGFITERGATITREPTAIERELAAAVAEHFIDRAWHLSHPLDMDLFAVQLSNILINVCNYVPGEKTVSQREEEGEYSGIPVNAEDGIKSFIAVLRVRRPRTLQMWPEGDIDRYIKLALKGEI